jgi:hypothetical protein
VTQVLKADPNKASSIAESLSDWTDNSAKQMAAVKQRVAGLVGSGQLGPFAHGYWGHPAMKLPPEINLIAVSHYLQALEYQRYSNQVVAMLGGKTPHIQNVAVGGVANAINLESEAALNVDRLFEMKSLLEKIVSFVQNVYVPDVCAIAGFYPDWFSYGAGVTKLPLRPRPSIGWQEHAVRAPRRLHPQWRSLEAGPHHRPEGRDLAPGGHRGQRARLVQRRRPAASVERRDRSGAHRVGRREEVLLGQSPALRRPARAGRPARGCTRRLRAGSSATRRDIRS